MTLENSEMLLAIYDKSRNDMSLSEQARLNAKDSYANMLKNIEFKKSLLDTKSDPETKEVSKPKK